MTPSIGGALPRATADSGGSAACPNIRCRCRWLQAGKCQQLVDEWPRPPHSWRIATSACHLQGWLQSLMAATGRDFSVSDCTAIPPRRVPSSRQRHRQPRLQHRSILCRQRPAHSSFNPNLDRMPGRRPNLRPGLAEQAVAFGTEFQHRMSRAMYGNWQQPVLPFRSRRCENNTASNPRCVCLTVRAAPVLSWPIQNRVAI